MHAQKLFKPARTDWAASMAFASKKDGSLRFRLDYQNLSAITKRDSDPISCMDECFASLGIGAMFTNLDANNGYWQVDVEETNRNKTTFRSHRGLYKFVQMPSELEDAPGMFQQATDVVLSPLKWQFGIVYLEGIVILSRSRRDHINLVKQILSHLREARVNLMFKTCNFFTITIDYFGHVKRLRR